MKEYVEYYRQFRKIDSFFDSLEPIPKFEWDIYIYSLTLLLPERNEFALK